jgi:hypothetical protein
MKNYTAKSQLMSIKPKAIFFIFLEIIGEVLMLFNRERSGILIEVPPNLQQ